MTQELRRKQIEEIVKSLVGKHFVGHEVEPECAILKNEKCDCGWQEFEDALVALLSDAECKGAWAVVRRVVEVHNNRDTDGPLASYNTSIGLVQAARQVAESFGTDPEGEKSKVNV